MEVDEIEDPALETPEIIFKRQSDLFYPAVDESLTPLPKSWSNHDEDLDKKLIVKNGGVRVEYKGSGKTHKDAASVRSDCQIPAACGIYYFEVKVISKGRDGYIGVGLSADRIPLNRLPGWDTNSFGYHGDDGNVFTDSGSGDKYGPTFTTGDVIGCCLNLTNRSIFFTKNGANLGMAFDPSKVPNRPLYPTVGLQTPGEIVEVNFGQKTFEFDFENHINSLRQKTMKEVCDFPVNDSNGHFQILLQNIVSGYLQHQGYLETAKSFSKATGCNDLEVVESSESRTSRSRLHQLILDGRISEAVAKINQDFPDLLKSNNEINFKLKYQQLLEIIAGTAGEIERYADETLENGSGDKIFDGCEKICGGKNAAVKDFIMKGRELQDFVSSLPSEQQNSKFDQIKKASSMLIDDDPRMGSNKELFDISHRERVVAALSSAILSSQSLPSQPTLALLVNQSKRLHSTMVSKGVPQAAFTQPDQFL